MITIYQIQINADQADKINGGETVPAFETKMKMAFGFDRSKFNESYLQYYVEAYRVYTDDLDEAFEITNLWNKQDKIDVIGDNGTSTSVGDIFVKDGDLYIVDNFGFVNVGRYEMEAA